MVEQVSRSGTERQVVAMIGSTAAKETTHSSSSESAEAAMVVTAACAASATSAGCALHHRSEADGLADPQIHRNVCRTGAEVDWNRAVGLSRSGNIETERICSRQHRTIRRTNRKSRTGVEDRRSKNVFRNGDVIWRSRTGEDEWAQS